MPMKATKIKGRCFEHQTLWLKLSNIFNLTFTAYCRIYTGMKNTKRTISPTARLEARLPVAAYAMLKRAAEIQGRTITDFVVTASCDAAKETIETTEIIRLPVEDQRLFAESIINPPEPNHALIQAAVKYHELLAIK